MSAMMRLKGGRSIAPLDRNAEAASPLLSNREELRRALC
jgi:hypothetical protein